MNEAFYSSVLQNPPKSYSGSIFDDRENIVWIDWGGTEDAIVDDLCKRIGAIGLRAAVADADNDWGYVVEIAMDSSARTIGPETGLDARQATLKAVDEMLSPVYEIRFVSDTNGSDTLGMVIERAADWKTLYEKWGSRLDEHFCPIRVLPDLLNTPGNEIDRACAAFAKRNG